MHNLMMLEIPHEDTSTRGERSPRGARKPSSLRTVIAMVGGVAALWLADPVVSSQTFDMPCDTSGRLVPHGGQAENRPLSQFDRILDQEFYLRLLIAAEHRSAIDWADLHGGISSRPRGWEVLEKYRAWREWQPVASAPELADLVADQRSWLDAWRAVARDDPSLGPLTSVLLGMSAEILQHLGIDDSDWVDLYFADLAAGFDDSGLVHSLLRRLIRENRREEAIEVLNSYVAEHAGDSGVRRLDLEFAAELGVLDDRLDTSPDPVYKVAWAASNKRLMTESTRAAAAEWLAESLHQNADPWEIERLCHKISDLTIVGGDRREHSEKCVDRWLGSTDQLLARPRDGWSDEDFLTVYLALSRRQYQAYEAENPSEIHRILRDSPEYRRMQLWQRYVELDMEGPCEYLSVAYRKAEFDDWVFDRTEVLECPKKIVLLDRMLERCGDRDARADLARRRQEHLSEATWGQLAFGFERHAPEAVESEVRRRIAVAEIPYRRVHQWLRNHASDEVQLAFYERWARDEPGEATPVYGKLRMLEALERPAVLTEALREAMRHRPEDLDLKLWHAAIAADQGKGEVAKQVARAVLGKPAASRRQRGEARLILGRVARREGFLDEASDHLDGYFSQRIRYNGCFPETGAPCDWGFVLHLIEAGDFDRLTAYAERRQGWIADYYSQVGDLLGRDYSWKLVSPLHFARLQDFTAWKRRLSSRQEVDVPGLLNRRFLELIQELLASEAQPGSQSPDELLARRELMPHLRREPVPARPW